jgi:tRNA-dihydrouridine synthase
MAAVDACPSHVDKAWEFWRTLGSPRFVSAPMVSGSDLAFRLQVRQHGIQLAYSPMMSASLLSRPGSCDLYCSKVFSTTEDSRDRPLFIQLAGNEPDKVAAAGKWMEKQFAGQFDAFDLNFGCPQLCARRGGYGAFVLEQGDTAPAVVRALVAAVGVPVTCKIRVLPSIADTIAMAHKLVDAGCVALTVHGRTRTEKGVVTALSDWDAIAAIRREVEIPLIANGGIATRFDAEMCMRVTGADAIMLAETLLEDPAAMGRPLSAQELGLLPPVDFWKSLTPRPWDDGRAMHIAVLKEFREAGNGTLAATARHKRPADDGDEAGEEDWGGDDDDGEEATSSTLWTTPVEWAVRAGMQAGALVGGSASLTISDTMEQGALSPDIVPKLGVRALPDDVVAKARAFLRTVPVAPAVGSLGTRVGPGSLDMAEEYLALAEVHGCQTKELYSHLFKILHGQLCTHPDLRRLLSCGSQELRDARVRSVAEAKALPRKQRAGAIRSQLGHLPYARGGTSELSEPMRIQFRLIREVLSILRRRQSAGWPLLRVRAAPSDWRGGHVPTLLKALSDPSSEVVAGVSRAQAVERLCADSVAPYWMMGEGSAAAPPAVTFDAEDDDASYGSDASSSSLARAVDTALSAAAPGAFVGTRVEEMDAHLAGVVFRKWPPTCCRDMQRRPGIPAGLVGTQPGLWYWRHNLDGMDGHPLLQLASQSVYSALVGERAVMRSVGLEPLSSGIQKRMTRTTMLSDAKRLKRSEKEPI